MENHGLTELAVSPAKDIRKPAGPSPAKWKPQLCTSKKGWAPLASVYRPARQAAVVAARAASNRQARRAAHLEPVAGALGAAGGPSAFSAAGSPSIFADEPFIAASISLASAIRGGLEFFQLAGIGDWVYSPTERQPADAGELRSRGTLSRHCVRHQPASTWSPEQRRLWIFLGV